MRNRTDTARHEDRHARERAMDAPASGASRVASSGQSAVASRPLTRPVSQWDWSGPAREERTPTPRSINEISAETPQAPLVLIVEDDQSIAEAMRLILEDAGCRVALASHGKAALALVRAERPALVLTDIMMPVMDGKELIAALRDDAARKGETPPPVVVMTATANTNARDLNADAVLRKPFDLWRLEELIARFLGGALGPSDGAPSQHSY